MKKITYPAQETRSTDIVAANVEELKSQFPDAFGEGGIQFDVLREILGDVVDEREEKYGLQWYGKRRARQIALTTSTGTLRPQESRSVNWATTKNLMIEGDNLEVLKLMQRPYAGKVKAIYIDPPYNTGNDFVYPDNFNDNLRNYLELTGQADGEGRRIGTNTEASGRFHTDWLNMMYPRLRLARNLLRNDGLIFVSIDDNEVHNLRCVMNEIFGEENFVATIVWQKMYSGKADATHFGKFHEYILCYALDAECATVFLLPRTEEMNARYLNPDNDPRGAWLSNDLTAAGERSAGHYKVRSPSGEVFNSPTGKHWLYSQERMEELISDSRVYFGKNGDAFPRLKRFLTEVQQGRRVNTIWSYEEVGHTDEGTKELRKLLKSNVEFQAPKPSRLIKQILRISTQPTSNDIVVDFFAGSGTTGQAVFELNAEDQGNRRVILVQLPEPTSGVHHKTIADITEERLRECGNALLSEHPLFKGDLGFRVFSLDSSNIRAWAPKRDDLPTTLEESIEHLKASRTETDILYELLLKLGLDLCVPIEQKKIAGTVVYSVGGGVLFACLAAKVTRDEVEPLAQGIVAWHEALAPAGDTTCVFRDSAFVDDVAKTNLAAILQQHGLHNVRSL